MRSARPGSSSGGGREGVGVGGCFSFAVRIYQNPASRKLSASRGREEPDSACAAPLRTTPRTNAGKAHACRGLPAPPAALPHAARPPGWPLVPWGTLAERLRNPAPPSGPLPRGSPRAGRPGAAAAPRPTRPRLRSRLRRARGRSSAAAEQATATSPGPPPPPPPFVSASRPLLRARCPPPARGAAPPPGCPGEQKG